MSGLEFHNSTHLADDRLRLLCRDAVDGWSIGRAAVRFRYSRGADFSGACYYRNRRIFVNIGRHVVYPYRMGTHVGRSKTVGRFWCKPRYFVELADGYQLAMFVFVHELYHLLVKRARRNTRLKESMCDRFATRFILAHFGGHVRTEEGIPVPREDWDFQDLTGFVAAARGRTIQSRTKRPLSMAAGKPAITTAPQICLGDQLWLFQ